MKFSVFADLHHYPGRYMGGTYEDLDFIEGRALQERCDFVIHVGDFCHNPLRFDDYVNRYRNFRLPTYHVPGNHDFDKCTHEETLSAYGLTSGYYCFDCKGYRFISLDTNYYYADGQYHPYSKGDYYPFEAGRESIPPEQLAWLERTVAEAPHPCVILSHASLERGADGCRNQEEVRHIINLANKRKPHTVLLCINGHHHKDHVAILDGVCYFDLNSASFEPLGVTKPHSLYPKELSEKFSVVGYTVVYNDPIHAVVSLEGTTIDVKGMESSLLLGVHREDTGDSRFDSSGREALPRVQSFRITL